MLWVYYYDYNKPSYYGYYDFSGTLTSLGVFPL